MLTFFRHYGLTICVALTILYVCIMPVSTPKGLNFHWSDKIVHAAMYVVFSLCVCYNFYREHTNFGTLKMAAWGIAFPALFGGLVELLQGSLTTTRSCEFADFVADIIGAVAGYLIAACIMPRHVERNIN